MNKKIFGNLTETGEWKRYLKDPDKHWKPGKSAKTLAHCWQEQEGFPECVRQVMGRSNEFQNLRMLLGIPEYEVNLPGKGSGSKNDIMVWATNTHLGPFNVAVEGKVDEGFGKTVSEWLVKGSGQGSLTNRKDRFESLCSVLNVPNEPMKQLPYQLLHRAASAVLTAQEFSFQTAMMLIHSFDNPESPTGFTEYRDFVKCFDVEGTANGVSSDPHKTTDGINLYFVWVDGDQKWTTL